MTEEQERTAFKAWHCGLYRGRQEEVAYAAWKARAALSQPASPGWAHEWLKCDNCGKDMRRHDRLARCNPASQGNDL